MPDNQNEALINKFFNPHYFTFYEFFAGAGMVRAGLGKTWKCTLANDINLKKAATYHQNWGSPDVMTARDISNIWQAEFPGRADLAWASFPCQDLSLAGNRAGLDGKQSSAFHKFWDHMASLDQAGRAPKMIVIENVIGALTSDRGSDFSRICERFSRQGYIYGAVVIDAALFVPQSRPRLFIIGVKKEIAWQSPLPISRDPSAFHTSALLKAISGLDADLMKNWVWWDIPAPSQRITRLIDLVEDNPVGAHWNTDEETRRLLASMTTSNLQKVDTARRSGALNVGAIYKRTRTDANGNKAVHAEVRFDGLAGCLRTPGGGSSRQTLLFVDGDNIRSRLLSARESARLMGLPDSYQLPVTYTDALQLTGDGVVVPVVRHLAQHVFEPILTPAWVGSTSARPQGWH